MHEISFPFTGSVSNIDLCILLSFLTSENLINPEIIGIDISCLRKITPESALKRMEEMSEEKIWISRNNNGIFYVPVLSSAYLILMCIKNPEMIINFSDYSLKKSNEKIILYTGNFKGGRIFLSIHQNIRRNLVKYRLDSDISHSADFLMNLIKHQYIPEVKREELKEKLYYLSEDSPCIRKLTEEDIRNFISVQIFLPVKERSENSDWHKASGLFYLIKSENDVSGIFEYDTEKNKFFPHQPEACIKENTDNSELLSEWLKGVLSE